MRKIIDLLSLNWDWLTGPVSIVTKLSYYFYVLSAFTGSILFGQKRIRFLGNWFSYDNFWTPVLLMGYPKEVGDMLAVLDDSPETVLEIGANTGQFITSLHASLDNLHADIFEPNSSVLQMLRANTERLQGITVYAKGVGPAGNKTFYYTPGKTSTGSLLQQNANSHDQALASQEIELVEDVSVETGRSAYDLVVIDVEGYEYIVMQSLKNIDMKYLYLEISTSKREKPYDHSALFELIRSEYGDFDIEYMSPIGPSKTMANVLLAFR